MIKPGVSQRLLIFAKPPLPGKVKTRLQPVFTPQQSACLHRRLVEHCLATAMALADTAIELWVGAEHGWWAQLAAKYPIDVKLQQGSDLGARMDYALQQALSAADKAVVIGTDCPFINVDYLRDAFRQLGTAELVIGPADDGGYVLMGLTQPQPALFTGIRWGSEQVLAQTLRQAAQCQLVSAQLASLMDIDRPADVLRLQQLLPALLQGNEDHSR